MEKYILSIKSYILVSSIVFLAGIILGYLLSYFFPNDVQVVVDHLKKAFEPLAQWHPIHKFIFVFLNNVSTCFLVILLGIVFGIVPIFSCLLNGEILGVLAYLYPQNFLIKVLPHGIIEIPAFILAVACGIKIGKLALVKILKRKKSINFRLEFTLTIRVLMKIIVPALIIAAAIEIFITPYLVDIISL